MREHVRLLSVTGLNPYLGSVRIDVLLRGSVRWRVPSHILP